MLNEFAVHPSLAASDVKRARAWYAEKLGLIPTTEFEDLLLYEVGPSTFTVYETPSAGTAKNTVAVWGVADLRAEVSRLRNRGVVFEEYDIPEIRTVEGIAAMDNDSLNAWFKDSDGNIVSMVQRPGDQPETQFRAMIAASDLERAKAWYAEKLGFIPREEFEGDMLGFESGSGGFSVYETPSAGTAKNTVATWRVPDLGAVMATLRGAGVVFEDYDFGDWRTINGVVTDSDGSLAAWFKDSEGNVLGLVQYSDQAVA